MSCPNSKESGNFHADHDNSGTNSLLGQNDRNHSWRSRLAAIRRTVLSSRAIGILLQDEERDFCKPEDYLRQRSPRLSLFYDTCTKATALMHRLLRSFSRCYPRDVRPIKRQELRDIYCVDTCTYIWDIIGADMHARIDSRTSSVSFCHIAPATLDHCQHWPWRLSVVDLVLIFFNLIARE